MAKWADILIYDAKTGSDGNHLELFWCRDDKGDTLGAPYLLSRMEVISKIKSGKTFCTIYEGNDGWRRGATIFIYSLFSREFVKTHRDGLQKDNLRFFAES